VLLEEHGVGESESDEDNRAGETCPEHLLLRSAWANQKEATLAGRRWRSPRGGVHHIEQPDEGGGADCRTDEVGGIEPLIWPGKRVRARQTQMPLKVKGIAVIR